MSSRGLRALAALAVAQSGCDREAATSAAAAGPVVATTTWLYEPAPLGWPIGVAHARVGRSLAPQRVASLGIAAPMGGPRPLAPLQIATPFGAPSGDTGIAATTIAPGPRGLGVLWGEDGGHAAVEAIDIDAGRTLWRDGTTCAGPVVGVTTETIVCVNGTGVRGVSLDGARHWELDAAFVAITDDRVAVAAADGLAIHDANDGTALGTVKLPAGVELGEVYATCGDSGREVIAMRRDGTLARIAEGKGGMVVAWAQPVPQLEDLDACAGDSVLARVRQADGRGAVLAFARGTGAPTGQVEDVRGWWSARDGSGDVELATGGGLVRAPRSLATQAVISPLVLGALLAARGERRLVRATPSTAVLLDAHGVAAFLPFAWPGAALGETAILAADWHGELGTVARLAIPPREVRAVRLPLLHPALPLPAELRDLPAAADIADAAVVEGAGAGADKVVAVAIAPEPAGTMVYALVTEATDGGGGIVAIDLATRAVAWRRADACGLGVPVAIAVAHDTVMCATTRATRAAAARAVVRATTRAGAPAWEWRGAHASTLQAAGSAVVVSGDDRAVVLDARTGREEGSFASEDGAAPPVIAMAAGHGVTYVVAAVRGRVVAAVSTGAMIPVWSLAVAGVVRSLAPADRALLVALEDGDAFRVDLETGDATPLAGLNLDWRTSGELPIGLALGGPIPGAPLPPPPPPRVPRGRRRLPPPKPDTDGPAMSTPRPLPPPLGQAWHVALFDPTGEFRARNDYPLFPPLAPSRLRAGGTAPLVIVSGPDQREALVIDPRTGDPLRRARLPVDAAGAITGGLVIADRPVAFAVYARPLRVALF